MCRVVWSRGPALRSACWDQTLSLQKQTQHRNTLESSGNFFLPSFEYQITFDGSGSAATPRANQFSSSETAVHSRPRSHLSVHMLIHVHLIIQLWSEAPLIAPVYVTLLAVLPESNKKKPNKRKTLHTVTNYS